jgi:DNA-binding MarR family transcriptional regulator
MKTTMVQEQAWNGYQQMRVRLGERISRELARETGLSEADFEILSALIESDDESVRSIALRCGLQWEKSRLSHQLRRMEQRGLVSREACFEDNRGSMVRITPLGRELAHKAKAVHEQTLQRYFFDALNENQLHALDEIAGTVLAGLGEPVHP